MVRAGKTPHTCRARARNEAAVELFRDAQRGCGSHHYGRRLGWNNVSFLAWIIVGLIAGALAKMAVPGEGPGGIVGDIIVGIVGAFLGGWIFNLLGHSSATGINLYSILVAFVGAVVLLFILRALTGRRSAV